MLSTTKVLADAGYRGMQKFHKNVQLPHRKSKKRPLSKDKKTENKSLSSQRVIVENVIGLLKRFKIISDRYRNRRRRFRITVQYYLWNLQFGVVYMSYARGLVYDEAEELNIPRKQITQNQDMKKFLTQQYTFLVLNKDYKEKFKGICSEYRSLKEELKSKRLRLNNEQEKYVFDKEEKKHVMGKLAKLNDEVDRLSKNFVQREHKENEPARKFDDEAINELRFYVIAETKQARKATEQERKALIEEKNAVEEIVTQLQMSNSVQMQLPSSAFSSVAHEPVAGPSWRR